MQHLTALGPPTLANPPVRAQRHSTDEDAGIRAFVTEAARLLHDLHCEDVLILDVRGLSDITDYILIASGTSDRQIRSLAQDLEDLGNKHDVVRIGRDIDAPANWLVIDLVDVVVHLFEAATRAHYDLEMMWGDAPRIEWRRNGEAKPADAPAAPDSPDATETPA